MADYKPYQDMNFRFAKLLEELSKTWPASDIAFVKDLASHSEYGEAMECLLALTSKNGKPVTPAQSATLSEMCNALGMQMPVTKAQSPRPTSSPPIPSTPQLFPR
jgi:hypothetical protein